MVGAVRGLSGKKMGPTGTQQLFDKYKYFSNWKMEVTKKYALWKKT